MQHGVNQEESEQGEVDGMKDAAFSDDTLYYPIEIIAGTAGQRKRPFYIAE